MLHGIVAVRSAQCADLLECRGFRYCRILTWQRTNRTGFVRCSSMYATTVAQRSSMLISVVPHPNTADIAPSSALPNFSPPLGSLRCGYATKGLLANEWNVRIWSLPADKPIPYSNTSGTSSGNGMWGPWVPLR